MVPEYVPADETEPTKVIDMRSTPSAVAHERSRRARLRVVCLECDKRFSTSNTLPECPRCGGSDIEIA